MAHRKVTPKKKQPLNPWIIGGLGALILVIIALIVIFGSSKGSKTTSPAAATGGVPTLVGTKQYSSAPPMLIDKSKSYTATVKMAKGGEFVIQLYADKAPITVNSFVFLVRQGYFDGVTFHRVLSGFMAQGGDPTGTGSGDPGFSFRDEIVKGLNFDRPGRLAMANSGPNTNGSQFFITEVETPHLSQKHTIFGQCDESSVYVLMSIARVARNAEDKPDTPVVLKKVTIVPEGQPLPPKPLISGKLTIEHVSPCFFSSTHIFRM